MKTKTVHVRRSEYDFYLGRYNVFVPMAKQRNRYGNPFIIGRDGTREEVIAKYRTWFATKIEAEPAFKEGLREFVGKRLACWCHPEHCHVDVIVEYVNALSP